MIVVVMGKRLEQQNTVETLNGDRDALLRFSVSFQVFTRGGGGNLGNKISRRGDYLMDPRRSYGIPILISTKYGGWVPGWGRSSPEIFI